VRAVHTKVGEVCSFTIVEGLLALHGKRGVVVVVRGEEKIYEKF